VVFLNPISKMRAVVAFLVLALAVANANVLFTRNVVPKGWTRGPIARPDSVIEFTIALKQNNLEQLESTLYDVSDPDSSNYQNFMTIDEIKNIVNPSKDDHDYVLNFLVRNGIAHKSILSLGDALRVKTTVEIASKIFDCVFNEFKSEAGKIIVRVWGKYSAPQEIAHHIDMVTGLSAFPIPHLRNHARATPSNDDPMVVPQTIHLIYQIPVEKPANATTTSQGVIEFDGQNFAPADLTAFGSATSTKVGNLPSNHIIGPNDPTGPQTEATLDIEAMGTANDEAAQWFWLEQGSNWLYSFSTHMFNTKDVPQVNSISYGWWEGDQCSVAGDECQNLGVDSTVFVQRVNAEFLKIGLRGISLISASGDSGANGRTDGDCTVPQLRPAYPASSPYITSVGATQLNHASSNLPNAPPICASYGPCASSGTEVAVSYDIAQFTSGGGFSNIAAMPSYQKTAVNAYLTSQAAKLPPASYFNKTGRGLPDVAAVGHNILIVQQGSTFPVGGTSASAPIFAAMMSLLTQVAVAKTGKPLGFLNPLLYKMYAADPSIFHDVTVGDNACTENGCSSSCKGFYCAAGWDPVTGLGSLNYLAARQYLEKTLINKL